MSEVLQSTSIKIMNRHRYQTGAMRVLLLSLLLSHLSWSRYGVDAKWSSSSETPKASASISSPPSRLDSKNLPNRKRGILELKNRPWSNFNCGSRSDSTNKHGDLIPFMRCGSSTSSSTSDSEVSTKQRQSNENNNSNVCNKNSIPRSTHHQHRHYHHSSDGSDDCEDDYDGTTEHYFHFNRHRPPWNPSPQIDQSGFLLNSYQRVPGEWENEVNLGGKFSIQHSTLKKSIKSTTSHNDDDDDNDEATSTGTTSTSATSSKNSDSDNTHINLNSPLLQHNNVLLQIPVRIRQVPGDGNCLFHSISTCYAHALNGTHLDFNSNLNWLYRSSASLRQQAVECLRKRRLLFLQGKEYLRSSDLVQAAAAQYGITPEEYCNLMAQDSYWGGGPEIVALCNVLKRPIHVYELATAPNSKNHHHRTNAAIASTSGLDTPSGGLVLNTRGSASFVLRRMACFGSPKFDHKQPFHILSADSRFPDITPGHQLPSGNHFLAVFPQYELLDEYLEAQQRREKEARRKKKKKRDKLRGGQQHHHQQQLSLPSSPSSASFKKSRTKKKSSASYGSNSSSNNHNHKTALQRKTTNSHENAATNHEHIQQVVSLLSLRHIIVNLWKRFFLVEHL